MAILNAEFPTQTFSCFTRQAVATLLRTALVKVLISRKKLSHVFNAYT